MTWQEECKIEVLYTQTRSPERPGGQHAGVPATFVRVTHLPTETVAEFGQARSQHKNKQIAMSMIEFALVEYGWQG